MEITTRQLAVDEWPLWRSLRLDALADAPAAFGSGLADWIDADEDRWRARIRDVALNVVATIDAVPAGQVSATTADAAKTVELISMWVAPDARGNGVGDALIDAVVSWATAQGASRVELSVKAANLPARHLYQRNQFRLVERIVNGDGEVRMVRDHLGRSPS